ncbi:MAG: hypothetical protein LBD99_02095 [Candidatus Margulisbacteria bacterium]|jgi:hypothetical protein|nr:hypothetical protein [Candidatus Margulisiibacteriota bacterium]
MRPEIPAKFEIVVKKERNAFKATCSIFPGVIGTGKNEEKAIEALADSLADKMGSAVKSALDEFLKKDLLRLLRTEAKISASLTPPRLAVNGAETAPPKFTDKLPKACKMQFAIPPIEMLLRGTNIRLDKSHPALRGLLLVLGLRTAQKDLCRRFACLEQEYMDALDDQFFFTLLNNGAFDTLQPTGHRTPLGMMLGIPLSFN